jgi:hypothetical protein
VLFHYRPTSASWLNQVEGFFGILGKQSLSMTDFYSKAARREHLAAYMRAWNRKPTPFAWTKRWDNMPRHGCGTKRLLNESLNGSALGCRPERGLAPFPWRQLRGGRSER